MTKEPFDFEKETEELETRLLGVFSYCVPGLMPIKPLPSRFKGYLIEYARLCFSQGRDRGLKEASRIAFAFMTDEEHRCFEKNILALKSKEVSGKDGE